MDTLAQCPACLQIRHLPHALSFKNSGLVKVFSIVNTADAFLELSCFFYDPMGVGNLISGTSAFSKSNLNFWKFTVHELLSLAWRILSITLLSCEMNATVQ